MRPDHASQLGGNRRQVDDPSPPGGPHLRQHRLGDQEHGLEVHREDVVPVLLGDPVDGPRLGDPRVVDQDAHGAQFGFHRLHQSGSRCGWKTVRHLSNVASLARAFRHRDQSCKTTRPCAAVLGSLDCRTNSNGLSVLEMTTSWDPGTPPLKTRRVTETPAEAVQRGALAENCGFAPPPPFPRSLSPL